MRPTDTIELRRIISRAARMHASKTALVTPERSWTFAEIDERTCRLANALRAHGVGAGSTVAVIRWNRPEHVEIALALLRVGAAMVNINPRLSPEEITWQISDSESTVVIASAEFQEALDAIAGDLDQVRAVLIFGGPAGRFLDYEEQLAGGSSSQPDPAGYSMDNVAHIRYTSGTTGRPKGVVQLQRTVLAVTRNLLLDYTSDLGGDDVFLPLQGLYHGAGAFVLPCWIRGVPIGVINDFSDPEAGIRAIQQFDASVIKTVPTVLTRLLASPALEKAWKESRVRTVVYGGSPMPLGALREGLDRYGQVFVQLYGQTESPMTIAVLEKQHHEGERLRSAGRPITMADVIVVDDDDQEVEEGIEGEVVVRGDHNMVGYWKQPEERTAEVMRNGWVHTGDLGLFKDGFLYLVDRKSEMIVTGGLNVYPNEVESVIAEHPDVLEAAVVSGPDDEWGECVVAMVVRKDGATLTESDLREFAADGLASFKRPRRVIFCDTLPKNAAGKVMRKVARESLWVGHARRIN